MRACYSLRSIALVGSFRAVSSYKQAMLPSRIRSTFLTWANRFEVAEHDLLTLEKFGVVSCESFYWKVPNPELLEKFLEQRIWPNVTARLTNGDLESSVREDMPVDD